MPHLIQVLAYNGGLPMIWEDASQDRKIHLQIDTGFVVPSYFKSHLFAVKSW